MNRNDRRVDALVKYGSQVEDTAVYFTTCTGDWSLRTSLRYGAGGYGEQRDQKEFCV